MIEARCGVGDRHEELMDDVLATARVAEEEAEEQMTFQEWHVRTKDRYPNDKTGKLQKRKDWQTIKDRIKRKKEEEFERQRQERILMRYKPPVIPWKKYLAQARVKGEDLDEIDKRIRQHEQKTIDRGRHNKAESIVLQEYVENRRQLECETKSEYIKVANTAVIRDKTVYVKDLGAELPHTPRSGTVDKTVITPRTVDRVPKQRRKIRGDHAEIIKFSRVDKHHELYEEKVAWETKNIHKAWFEDQRQKDVHEWSMQRIVLEQKVNTETACRAAKIDHENKKMAKALKEANDQKEQVKLEHKLLLEMQLLKKKQLKIATKWFIGNRTGANFTAWKEYTSHMIIQRAETRNRRIRQLKYSIVCLLVCAGLAIGGYYLLRYIEAQNADYQKKLKEEEEVAAKSLNRNQNNKDASDDQARRFLRHDWAQENEPTHHANYILA